jgi:hypothetical protein
MDLEASPREALRNLIEKMGEQIWEFVTGPVIRAQRAFGVRKQACAFAPFA